MKKIMVLLVFLGLVFGVTSAMAGKGAKPRFRASLDPYPGNDYGQSGSVTGVGLGPSTGCDYQYKLVIRAKGLNPQQEYHVGIQTIGSVTSGYSNKGGNFNTKGTVCCNDLVPPSAPGFGLNVGWYNPNPEMLLYTGGQLLGIYCGE